MPFMMPQIQLDDWYVVETDNGTEYIPMDVCVNAENATDLRDYLEGSVNEESELEVTRQYGARLSASGYMDCTEWSIYRTENEARKSLEEMYEICTYCGEEMPHVRGEETKTNCDKCSRSYLTD